MNGEVKGVFDGRAFRRVRKNSARIKELEGYELDMKTREREMADTRVKDIEDWIRIVQTRTRLKDVLRKVLDDIPGAKEEAEALLEEIT
jgi:hypothetical protein